MSERTKTATGRMPVKSQTNGGKVMLYIVFILLLIVFFFQFFYIWVLLEVFWVGWGAGEGLEGGGAENET